MILLLIAIIVIGIMECPIMPGVLDTIPLADVQEGTQLCQGNLVALLEFEEFLERL